MQNEEATFEKLLSSGAVKLDHGYPGETEDEGDAPPVRKIYTADDIDV